MRCQWLLLVVLVTCCSAAPARTGGRHPRRPCVETPPLRTLPELTAVHGRSAWPGRIEKCTPMGREVTFPVVPTPHFRRRRSRQGNPSLDPRRGTGPKNLNPHKGTVAEGGSRAIVFPDELPILLPTNGVKTLLEPDQDASSEFVEKDSRVLKRRWPSVPRRRNKGIPVVFPSTDPLNNSPWDKRNRRRHNRKPFTGPDGRPLQVGPRTLLEPDQDKRASSESVEKDDGDSRVLKRREPSVPRRRNFDTRNQGNPIVFPRSNHLTNSPRKRHQRRRRNRKRFNGPAGPLLVGPRTLLQPDQDINASSVSVEKNDGDSRVVRRRGSSVPRRRNLDTRNQGNPIVSPSRNQLTNSPRNRHHGRRQNRKNNNGNRNQRIHFPSENRNNLRRRFKYNSANRRNFRNT